MIRSFLCIRVVCRAVTLGRSAVGSWQQPVAQFGVRRMTTADDNKDIQTISPSAPDASTNVNSKANAKSKPNSKTKRKTPVEPVILQEKDIDEKHIRGSGNGGQKINKTSSCVQLMHRPTGTIVVCQDTRFLQQNRKIAYKRLKEKLDLQINGTASKIGKKVEKLRARKHKQRQRAKKKYQQKEVAESDDPEQTFGPCDTER